MKKIVGTIMGCAECGRACEYRDYQNEISEKCPLPDAPPENPDSLWKWVVHRIIVYQKERGEIQTIGDTKK